MTNETKREKVTEGRTEICHEQIQDLNSGPNITKVIKTGGTFGTCGKK
jgi:hypothetical protein